MQMNVSEGTPLTVFRFAVYNLGEKQVQDALFLTVLIVIACTIGLAALYSLRTRETIHGKARWASLPSIAKKGMLGGKGILLGKVGDKFLSLPGELFALVAAPTRSGKGVGIVIPNLLNWPDSAVVLDVKFENYEITSGFREKHGQKVFLFNPTPRDYMTHRYNALGYISEDPNHRIDDIQKIANFLLPTPPKSDPMWTSEGRDLFFGIVLLLLDVEEFPVTIGEVLRQLKTEEETSVYLANLISHHKENLCAPCISSIANFINKPPKERSGVKSGLTTALNLWSNPLIDAATSANDFDLRELRKKRMTIYIGVTPDNLTRLAPLINLFVQQLIDLNTQELPAKYDNKGKRLSGNPDFKYQVLLLLDEFTAIGRLEILEKAIAFIAGYGIRMMTIIQSVSQLRSVYGADVAETFQKNHAATVVFRPEKMKEAEEIANELGFKTVEQKSTSTPKMFGGTRGEGSISKSDTKRPLLLPQEVKMLGDNEAIILSSGLLPIKATKIRYYDDPHFTRRLYGKTPIPTIDVSLAALRGEKEDIDLSFMYEKVSIPDDGERKLTDQEIEEATNSFFETFIEQAEGEDSNDE